MIHTPAQAPRDILLSIPLQYGIIHAPLEMPLLFE